MSHTYAFMATALCPVGLDKTGDIKVEHKYSRTCVEKLALITLFGP